MIILINYAYEAHHIAMEERDQPKTNGLDDRMMNH